VGAQHFNFALNFSKMAFTSANFAFLNKHFFGQKEDYPKAKILGADNWLLPWYSSFSHPVFAMTSLLRLLQLLLLLLLVLPLLQLIILLLRVYFYMFR